MRKLLLIILPPLQLNCHLFRLVGFVSGFDRLGSDADLGLRQLPQNLRRPRRERLKLASRALRQVQISAFRSGKVLPRPHITRPAQRVELGSPRPPLVMSQRPNQAAYFFERVPSKHLDRQPQPLRLNAAAPLEKS